MSEIRREVRRVKTGKTVWLAWDCSVCERKGISGEERVCPSCGRPRGATAVADVNRRMGYVQKEAGVSGERKPDWLCNCCDSYNSDDNSVCEFCTAPRGASKDYFQVQKENQRNVEAATKEAEEATLVLGEYTQGTNSYPFGSFARPIQLPTEEANKFKRHKSLSKGKLFKYIGLSLALLFVVMLLLPKNTQVTVESKLWKYTINIEEVTTYHESGWSLPAGAIETSRDWRWHEDRQVIDHYDALPVEVTKSREVWDHDEVTKEYIDNGDFTADEVEVVTPIYRTEYYTEIELQTVPVYRTEAVYDWYYYYDIDRATVTRQVVTSGSDTEPYWGEVVLQDRERQGRDDREFSVIALYGEEHRTYKVTEGNWYAIEVGDTLVIRKGILSGPVKIISINGAKVK